MNPEITIDAEFIIRDLDTLKSITHPLRLQLLKTIKEPRTVKEISAVLEIPPTKLYYHINQLEKFGIIRVVDTNIVSGIIEKTYQVTARSYKVDENLLLDQDMDDEALDKLLSAILDTTKVEIKNSFRAGLVEWGQREKPNKGGMARAHLHFTEEEAVEFYGKLESLIKEYSEAGEKNIDNPDIPAYGLTIAFYPVAKPSTTDLDDN
jgi:DNA-binding transcriptional ArsR family regulator